VPTAPRANTARRRIQDTTALSLFIQEPNAEHPAVRSRMRSARVATTDPLPSSAAPGDTPHADLVLPPSSAVPGHAMSRRPTSANGFSAPSPVPSPASFPRSPTHLILQNGGLRLLPEMSVFLNKDDHIILADAESGMAALVTGVTKVGDTELATIAGLCPQHASHT
jgi:hypothetical protein